MCVVGAAADHGEGDGGGGVDACLQDGALAQHHVGGVGVVADERGLQPHLGRVGRVQDVGVQVCRECHQH